MSIADYIVLGIVGVLVAAAFIFARRRRGSCCGNCSKCHGCKTKK